MENASAKIEKKLQKQLIDATTQQEVALIQAKLNSLRSGK